MLNELYNEKGSAGYNKDADLYPPMLKQELDTVNEITYEGINNGVYKCGF